MKTLTWTWKNIALTTFMSISIFWLMGFISNLSKMTISVATATYYFNNINFRDEEIAGKTMERLGSEKYKVTTDDVDRNPTYPAEVCSAWTITYF
jgi:hypothetical protein